MDYCVSGSMFWGTRTSASQSAFKGMFIQGGTYSGKGAILFRNNMISTDFQDASSTQRNYGVFFGYADN